MSAGACRLVVLGKAFSGFPREGFADEDLRARGGCRFQRR